MEEKTDCQVCKKLIKEKHRNMIWWKVCCIIFAALAIVLGILYFGSGAVVTETTIEIGKSDSQNQGDDNVVIIGGNENTINGTIKEMNYTPVICLSVVICVASLIVGGVIVANHFKKENDN